SGVDNSSRPVTRSRIGSRRVERGEPVIPLVEGHLVVEAQTERQRQPAGHLEVVVDITRLITAVPAGEGGDLVVAGLHLPQKEGSKRITRRTDRIAVGIVTACGNSIEIEDATRGGRPTMEIELVNAVLVSDLDGVLVLDPC